MIEGGSPDTSQTLLDLAERCEKATGPIRNLDFEIASATGWECDAKTFSCIAWRAPDEVSYRSISENWPLQFTASIDAAMSLVPEELHWVLKSSDPKAIARIGGWKVGNYRIIGGEATTPALALCAASLRARSTRPDTVQGK